MNVHFEPNRDFHLQTIEPLPRAGRESKIERGWDFFQEIIRCPVPLDMNPLQALSRSSLGLDLYLWVTSRSKSTASSG